MAAHPHNEVTFEGKFTWLSPIPNCHDSASFPVISHLNSQP